MILFKMSKKKSIREIFFQGIDLNLSWKEQIMEKKGNRLSNIELLRIVSMLGIITLHYFHEDMGGVSTYAVFPNFIWIFSKILQSMAVPLVNCFVLITGYFMISKKELSFRKPVELLLITVWYGLISYGISILCGVHTFSLSGFLYATIPFFEGKRWFVETYIILILLAPFMNKTLIYISKKTFELLLCIQLLLFSVWYSVGLSAPLLDDGYGIINFITLYMIGSYLRLHGNSIRWISKSIWMGMVIYLGCSAITFCMGLFENSFGYAFITNIVGSVALFVIFLQMDFGSNKTINRISSYVFDVYFVHSDTNTSKLLFQNVLKSSSIGNNILVLPHLLVTLPLIYLLGIVAGWLRKRIWKKSVGKWLNYSEFVNQKIEV